MNYLVKATGKRGLRVHADRDGRPACGGGYRAKSNQWQTDIGPCNCVRCLAILKRQTSHENPEH